jgi:orotate phosphoribosyltransferase
VNEELIKLLTEESVIRFGSFQTKAGRKSPYFCDFGSLSRAGAVKIFADALAAKIMDLGLEFDTLYGPAYKGIPLAVAVGQSLQQKGNDVQVVYNRKEKKDHGEGGQLVGKLSSRSKVIIIEDVLSAGTSLRESVALLGKERIVASVVILDRQEKGQSLLAREELENEFKIPIYSVLEIKSVIDVILKKQWIKDLNPQILEDIRTYWDKHKGS